MATFDTTFVYEDEELSLYDGFFLDNGTLTYAGSGEPFSGVDELAPKSATQDLTIALLTQGRPG